MWWLVLASTAVIMPLGFVDHTAACSKRSLGAPIRSTAKHWSELQKLISRLRHSRSGTTLMIRHLYSNCWWIYSNHRQTMKQVFRQDRLLQPRHFSSESCRRRAGIEAGPAVWWLPKQVKRLGPRIGKHGGVTGKGLNVTDYT